MVAGVGKKIGVSYFSSFCRIFFYFSLFFLSQHCYISKGHSIFCIYCSLPQKECFSEIATSNFSHFQVPSYRHFLEYQVPDPLAFDVRYYLFEGVLFCFVLCSIQILYSFLLFMESLKPFYSILCICKHVNVGLCGNLKIGVIYYG